MTYDKEHYYAVQSFLEDDDLIPFPRYEIRERLDKYVSQFMKSIEVEGDND